MIIDDSEEGEVDVRIPGYLLLRDNDGARHLIRASSIQLLSDLDPCRDATIAVVAGRSITVPISLEEFIGKLADCDRYRLR